MKLRSNFICIPMPICTFVLEVWCFATFEKVPIAIEGVQESVFIFLKY